MEENNKLALSNTTNLVVRVSTTVSITNKLIAENNRQLVLEIFERNPKFFIEFISKYYPLNERIIEEHSEILNWKLLSMNKNLLWSNDFIGKFETKWDWGTIIRTNHFPLNAEFVKSFIHNLPHHNQLGNYILSNDIEIIKIFQDKWYSYKPQFKYCTEELILEFYNDLDWNHLSYNKDLKLSYTLIEKYCDKWNWKHLSINKNLSWSIEFIEKFSEKLDWAILSKNDYLPWTYDFLKKYENKLNWDYVSLVSTLPWSEQLIEVFYDKWNWDSLSSNKFIPWTEELIEKYKSKWLYGFKVDGGWKGLSINKKLPWSTDLIDRYISNWDWHGLSLNRGLPWSIDFFEKYPSKWHLYHVHQNIKVNFELLIKYEEKMNWKLFDWNCVEVWSEPMIQKYFEKIIYNDFIFDQDRTFPWTLKLLHENISSVKLSDAVKNMLLPYVDDGVISTVLKNKNL